MLHNIYEQILKVTVTCDFLGNRLPIGIFIETLSNEIGTYLFDFHSGKKIRSWWKSIHRSYLQFICLNSVFNILIKYGDKNSSMSSCYSKDNQRGIRTFSYCFV